MLIFIEKNLNKTINSSYTRKNPSMFPLNDEYITDNMTSLNNCFVNIGNRSTEYQNASLNCYLTKNITLRLHFQAVNKLDLISIIRVLKEKQSWGYYDIYPTVIMPVIIKPLVQIINYWDIS